MFFHPILIALALAFMPAKTAPEQTSAVSPKESTDMARPGGSFMPERKPMLAPMGYIVFCVQNRAACRLSVGPQSIELTAAHMDNLVRVNRTVNRAIKPRRDVGEGFAADKWDLEPAAGDCKDYALTKRHRLISLGWPAPALRLATAQTPSGEGHTVLVIRTSGGDVVLDNRSDRILDWQATDLYWIGIQSARNPKHWNRVAPSMPGMLASAN